MHGVVRQQALQHQQRIQCTSRPGTHGSAGFVDARDEDENGSDSGWEMDGEGEAGVGGKLQQILTTFRAATARSARLAQRQTSHARGPLLARPLSDTHSEEMTTTATTASTVHGIKSQHGPRVGSDGLTQGYSRATRSSRIRNNASRSRIQASADLISGAYHRIRHAGPEIALDAATAAAAAAARVPQLNHTSNNTATRSVGAHGNMGPVSVTQPAGAAAATATSALMSAGFQEAVAAAQREVVFESLQRGAAESALVLTQQALGRVKARLRLSQQALEASRAAQIPPVGSGNVCGRAGHRGLPEQCQLQIIYDVFMLCDFNLITEYNN